MEISMYKLITLALMMWGSLASAQQGYPLDQEMTSSFGANRSVEMSCKVSKVGANYVYMYSIKNKSTTPIKVKWDVMNQAMYFGHNLDLLLELEPDENVVFTLEHPEPPVQTSGRVTTFYLTSSDQLVKMIKGSANFPKNMDIGISKKSLYNSESGSGYGALPKTWVYPNFNRVR